MEENGSLDIIIEHLNEAFVNGVDGHVSDMSIFTKKWNIPYEAIQCPVHIWHGEEDTLAPLPGAIALSKMIKNANTLFIPKAGHLIMEKEELLKEILVQI